MRHRITHQLHPFDALDALFCFYLTSLQWLRSIASEGTQCTKGEPPVRPCQWFDRALVDDCAAPLPMAVRAAEGAKGLLVEMFQDFASPDEDEMGGRS